MENQIDIGAKVRLCLPEHAALVVGEISGGSLIVDDLSTGKAVMLPREWVALAEDAPAQADTPEDQFTGADMGAQMAAAERVTCRACECCSRFDENVVFAGDPGDRNDEVGECTQFAQFRSLDLPRLCSAFIQRPAIPLTVSGG